MTARSGPEDRNGTKRAEACAAGETARTLEAMHDGDAAAELHPALHEGLKIGHVSDTHIGYEAYRALSVSGENQRAVDIAKAFTAACQDIIDWDPPVVVHTGDVAERPHVPIRMMLLIRQWFEKVASIRPDGTRRQLVVIAGNHEQPASRREACFLELYRGIPGVTVVTNDYRQVRFDDAGQPGGAAAELADVVLHCLPHESLKSMAFDDRFDEVVPVDGKVNVLLAHGVAGGSGLYKRVLGREFAIPTDVLARGWDYGALGHWHRQGPVPIVATGGARDGSSGRIWYAGSTENCGFGDLLDNGSKRGYLRVVVRPGEMPEIERRHLPIRSMFRLPVLQGKGLSPEQIGTELRDRIKAAGKAGELSGAVVGQIVKGVPRDIWALVDVAGIRDHASEALHYEITVEPVARVVEDADGEERIVGLGDIGAVLDERARAILADDDVAPALALAKDLLSKYLAESPVEEGDAAADDADVTPIAAPGKKSTTAGVKTNGEEEAA